ACVAVVRGVTTVAVDEELDEGGAEAVPGSLDGVAGDVVGREHVHAVDVVAGHAVGVGLHGDVLGAGLVTEVDADRVAVVLAGEDDRGALCAGEVDAGVPVALAGGAIT